MVKKAYASYELLKGQGNYSAINLELFALVFSTYFKNVLWGKYSDINFSSNIF